MIVNFKRAGVWIVQYGKMVEAKKDKEGKSTQETVFTGQGIKIGPGLNTIKDEIWNVISKYPDVKKKIDSGVLEVIEQPASGKKAPAPADEDGGSSSPAASMGAEIESLVKYDQKKAISIVQGIMEAKQLEALRPKEKRAMVLKAIKEQLAKVSKADAAFEGKE